MNPPRRIPAARALASRLPVLAALTLCALVSCAAPALAVSSKPGAITGRTSNVTFSSATLYGYVNASGLPTTYVFDYGTTGALGSQTPIAPAGNGTITLKFNAGVTGLQPATTYHYRIVATNSAGTKDGAQRTFTTGSVPLSLQIAGVPNPVVFGSPFVVEGNLSGTGAAGHEVTLQVDPFPYLIGFKDVGNPELTSSTGGFTFPFLGLLENTQVRVVTVGKPEVASPPIVESVAVRVSLHARRTRRPGYVYLYGQVAPVEDGALVGFQLMRPGRSVNEGGTVVKAAGASGSRFARVVRIPRPGVYRALVKISDGAHVSSYSPPILIR